MTPPADGAVLINDGNTITVSSTFAAGDDYDTDYQATSGGGTLTVTDTGNLVFNTARLISNSHGEGRLTLDGRITQSAASATTITASLVASEDAWLRAESSVLRLTGGGSYSNGTLFDAAGGSIELGGGTHALGAVQLAGSGYVRITAGQALVSSTIGTTSGAASGGVAIEGGTLAALTGLGGSGAGRISADHGILSSGRIEGAKLRFTGNATKSASSTLDIADGSLTNDGKMTHLGGGIIDVDPAGSTAPGMVSNRGTWNLSHASVVKSTEGAGSFSNSGSLVLADGASIFTAPVTNLAGGEINVSGGATLSMRGGGSYQNGSVLNTNGGTLSLEGGNHSFLGTTLTGSGDVVLNGLLAPTSVAVVGNVGPVAGLATGGFTIVAGTVSDFSGLGGGGDTMSVDHGALYGGVLNGVTLRYTGNFVKKPGIFNILTGTLVNDGLFTHEAGGTIGLDITTASDGGSISNNGIWNITGNVQIIDAYGRGSIHNHGQLLHQNAGAESHFSSKLTHYDGAAIRVAGSVLSLDRGGLYQPGSVLEIDDGTLLFGGGTHVLDGCTLTGSGSIRVAEFASAMIGTQVGPTSGPATGGFAIMGGQVTDDSGLIGGGIPDHGKLSADHGEFSSGTVVSGKLRFTGHSIKQSGVLGFVSGLLLNEGTFDQQAGGNFNLDTAQSGSSGQLSNSGTWTFSGAADILSTYGSGAFKNSGLLIHAATGTSHVNVPLNLDSGGEIRVDQGALSLQKGGTYDAGSTLNAAAGPIQLNGGVHVMWNPTLAGASNVELRSGSVSLLADIGALTGPATGGFSLAGGTLTSSGLLGGAFEASLAADHGILAAGALGKATLRYTGNVSTSPDCNVQISGTLVNEGTLSQNGVAVLETDATTAAGAGLVINAGTWTMDGACAINNTQHEGVFRNTGLLQQKTGSNAIHAAFIHESGATLQSLQGQIYLDAGGTYAANSVLDADGGANSAAGYIFLNGGTHEFNGVTLTGSTFTAVSAGRVNVHENSGPTSGTASGGFALYGGTTGGEAMLSADHGFLFDGSIDGTVTLRFTGDSHKQDGTLTRMYGGTLRNDGVFGQGTNGNFDLDPTGDAGAGVIVNNGTWNIGGSNLFSNTYGGGSFVNAGFLSQTGGNVTLAPAFTNRAGSKLSVSGGTIYLTGGGLHETGSTLDASGGGGITLTGPAHVFEGGTFNGDSYVTLAAGTIANLNGNVGSTTGSATGGISMDGRLNGTSMLSIDHASFGNGTLDGNAVVRITGQAASVSFQTFNMAGGTIRNEGIFNQPVGSSINADSEFSGGAGVILNRGAWNFNGNNAIYNAYQGGVIRNENEWNQLGGSNVIQASFENRSGGILNSTAGSVYLRGGGTQEPGSRLNADGGSIYFDGGTHDWNGGALDGSSSVYASAGVVHLAGTIGATSGDANGGFGIIGGTVNGDGTLSCARGYFSSGQIGGSVTLRFTSEFIKATNSQINLDGGTIQNDGTFSQSTGGNFDLDSGMGGGAGILRNTGEWNITGNNSYYNSFGGGRFENSGAFNVLGGENHMLAPFYNGNGGTVTVHGGNLYLRGGHTSGPGSALVADGGDIYFSNGAQWLSGGTLGGSSFIYLGARTTTVTTDTGATSGPAQGNIGITGGTLDGSAMLSVNKAVLGAGLITGSVTLRLTGASEKSASSTLRMDGGMIRNDGTLHQLANGSFDLDAGFGGGAGWIQNNGTWHFDGTNVFYNSYGAGVFDNTGTLHQNSGSTLFNARFDNHGVAEVHAGYLQFLGGGTQMAGSALVASGGDFYFSNGTHEFQGNPFSGDGYVYLTGGRINITADVNASSEAATGGFGITSGTLGGNAILSADHGSLGNGFITDSVKLRLTGTSTKIASTNLSFDGGVLQNEGTFNQTSYASFELDAGFGGGAGTVLNKGTWNLNGISQFYNSYGNGIFLNEGSLHQNAGQTLFNARFDNHGTATVHTGYTQFLGGGIHAAGSSLLADGGDFYFSNGTHEFQGNTFSGDGYVYLTGGRINITADVNASSGAATGGFGITSGTLGGDATLSADHGSLGNGFITDNVKLRLTGTSTKIASTNLSFDGGVVQNEGTFNQTSYASFELDAGFGGGAGTVLNKGTWNLNGISQFYNSYGNGAFLNEGSLHQNAGQTLFNARFDNHGTAIAHTGYTQFLGGGIQMAGSALNADGGDFYFSNGTHEFQGNTFSGDGYVYLTGGRINVTSDVNASSGAATGGFGITAGTLGGNATVSADHGYLGNGFITDNVTLRFTGTTTKIASTNLSFDGGVLQNEGTFHQASYASFELDAGFGGGAGSIRNKGTWNLSGNNSCSNSYSSGSWINDGLLDSLAGVSTFQVALQNHGTLRVSSGTLYLQQAANHSGSFIANGALVLNGASHLISGSAAALAGNGTLYGSAILADGAKLAPGDTIGTLTIAGNVNLASNGVHPRVDIDLDPQGASDQILLGNGASLNLGNEIADLVIHLHSQPVYGARHRIVAAPSTSGSCTGRFANAPNDGTRIHADYMGQSHTFAVEYGADGKTIDLLTLNPYQVWAEANGMTGNDAAVNADPDGDGIANGMEYLLGGIPSPSLPGHNSTALLPSFIVDPDFLHVYFRRTARSIWMNPTVCHSGSPAGPWTAAVDGVDGVSVDIDGGYYEPSIDRVHVKIPRTMEIAGKLFARVVVTTP